ncbi:hypothetical protein CCR75_009499 [Bremia lactucae]|uniref:Uncharacterized protein n=1 Tax=Bremia lactucae TaxID=4779 RepID=A0A976FKN0_BRELC|nr:hypothetical protein CCR75_009499 [Bremia lactucae]
MHMDDTVISPPKIASSPIQAELAQVIADELKAPPDTIVNSSLGDTGLSTRLSRPNEEKSTQ